MKKTESIARYEFVRKNLTLIFYLLVLITELIVIQNVTDLSNWMSNWLEKSRQIASFEVPTDNFYGPGAAILLLPFSFYPDSLYLANYFYFTLGSLAYWKLTELIPLKTARFLSRLALPANFYLIWLIYSSQDTVFEYFLLLWGCYLLVKKRYVISSLFLFLLCLTRSGYWIFFLGTSLALFVRNFYVTRQLNFRMVIAFPLLITISIFNYNFYDSPSPALGSGMTSYFSYTKYHYLALPKMDVDVFLSGPKGIYSKEYGPDIPPLSSPAESSAIYQAAAFDSLLENKKEVILGWMQKYESYFFGVQKVPHLPGSYVLDQELKTINIENDRLEWHLVIGNLVFLLLRSLLLVFGLVGVGLFIASKLYTRRRSELSLWVLALPYFFGIFPGMLYYTETRFKIVSELLLVPLIAQLWSSFLQSRRDLLPQIGANNRVNN